MICSELRQNRWNKKYSVTGIRGSFLGRETTPGREPIKYNIEFYFTLEFDQSNQSCDHF